MKKEKSIMIIIQLKNLKSNVHLFHLKIRRPTQIILNQSRKLQRAKKHKIKNNFQIIK